jgi:hypothetical protein
MSSTWTRLAVAATIVLAGAAPALAQTPAQSPNPKHGINAREARQAERIKDAKEDGKLTKGELDKLRADEAALRARERVFRESGQGLDSKEYKALEKELNRLSKEISRATHNGKK